MKTESDQLCVISAQCNSGALGMNSVCTVLGKDRGLLWAKFPADKTQFTVCYITAAISFVTAALYSIKASTYTKGTELCFWTKQQPVAKFRSSKSELVP